MKYTNNFCQVLILFLTVIFASCVEVHELQQKQPPQVPGFKKLSERPAWHNDVTSAVRKEPSGEILFWLEGLHKEVTILGKTERTYLIRTDKGEGFIEKGKLDLQKSGTAQLNERVLEIRYCKVNTANLRSGPSTNYEKVGLLRMGDKVEIIEKKAGWCKIRRRDVAGISITGWVAGWLLSAKKVSKKAYTASKAPSSKQKYEKASVSKRYTVGPVAQLLEAGHIYKLETSDIGLMYEPKISDTMEDFRRNLIVVLGRGDLIKVVQRKGFFMWPWYEVYLLRNTDLVPIIRGWIQGELVHGKVREVNLR